MNGMIRHARFGIGALGITLLTAFGCGGRDRPAREPTPPFESRVGEPAAPAEQMPPQGAEQMPPEQGVQPGQDQTGMGQPGMGQPGMGQPEQQPPQTPDVGQQQPQVDKVMICRDLTTEAKMVVADVQGGVAIVLSPKPDSDMSRVKEVANRAQSAMSTTEGAEQAPQATECALFDIGGGAAAAVSVVEGTNDVRLLFTTTDPTAVKSMRNRAREFVKSAKQDKSNSKQKKQNGATQQP